MLDGLDSIKAGIELLDSELTSGVKRRRAALSEASCLQQRRWLESTLRLKRGVTFSYVAGSLVGASNLLGRLAI